MIPNDPMAGARVLLDGKPGTIVRSFDDVDGPGYDVDMDDGTHRWISHAGSKLRMVDLPPGHKA